MFPFRWQKHSNTNTKNIVIFWVKFEAVPFNDEFNQGVTSGRDGYYSVQEVGCLKGLLFRNIVFKYTMTTIFTYQ